MKLKHLMGVLLVLLLGSGIAKAQTEYGFSICGVGVDSGNVDKLNEIEEVTVGAGGHISYSPETNTLSIKDVSIQTRRGSVCLHVYSAYKNLPFTLHLEGKISLTPLMRWLLFGWDVMHVLREAGNSL